MDSEAVRAVEIKRIMKAESAPPRTTQGAAGVNVVEGIRDFEANVVESGLDLGG